MSPHSALAAELHLVLTHVEAQAAVLRAAHLRGQPAPHGRLDDHRTHVLGELLDAIERVEPGMGRRFQTAMYPTSPDEEEPSQPGEAMPSKPTDAQIEAEIKALETMKPTVRKASAFGDDNHAAIDAQLQVLRERMDTGNVYVEFGDETRDEFDQHILDSANHACDWLQRGGTSPSTDWAPLTR